MGDAMMIDQARLVASGWRQALSGRWFHDDMPAIGAANRRRLFSTQDALALLDVSDAIESNQQGEPA